MYELDVFAAHAVSLTSTAKEKIETKDFRRLPVSTNQSK